MYPFSCCKVLQYHRKKLCIKCNRVTDHTCFHMRYRRSETNDDAYAKAETWNCHTDSRACEKHQTEDSHDSVKSGKVRSRTTQLEREVRIPPPAPILRRRSLSKRSQSPQRNPCSSSCSCLSARSMTWKDPRSASVSMRLRQRRSHGFEPLTPIDVTI